MRKTWVRRRLASGIEAQLASRSLLLVLVGGLCLVAVACRLWALDRLPGLNADEAWLSVQVLDFLAGRPTSLFTPTGNLLNIFHALPTALVEVLHPYPSVLNLRLPAAAAGLLLMALSYPLTRTVLGPERALVFAVLVWVLPQHIGYARFGWDSSETPLVTLLCLASALHGRTAAMVCALLAALWVHPTNLGLVPIVAGVVVGQVVSGHRRLRRRDYVWIVLGSLAVGVFFIWRLSALVDFGDRSTPLPSAGLLFETFIGWGRLLSGATILQYIVGPLSEPKLLAFDLVSWGVVLCLLVTGLPQLVRRREGAILGLTGGTLLSLCALTATSGIRPLTPGWERYAMFLTVPSCLLLAGLMIQSMPATRGADRTLSRSPVLLAMIVAASCWLALFVRLYHVELETRGTRSYGVFASGEVEPKAAAFALIEEEAPDGPVFILADTRWLYWPFRYFAAHDSRIRVVRFPGAQGQALLDSPPPHHSVFGVGFPQGTLMPIVQLVPLASALNRPLRLDQIVWRRSFSDPLERPILYIWRLRAPIGRIR